MLSFIPIYPSLLEVVNGFTWNCNFLKWFFTFAFSQFSEFNLEDFFLLQFFVMTLWWNNPIILSKLSHLFTQLERLASSVLQLKHSASKTRLTKFFISSLQLLTSKLLFLCGKTSNEVDVERFYFVLWIVSRTSQMYLRLTTCWQFVGSVFELAVPEQVSQLLSLITQM